jgi:GT2 family glycosyltransferase
VGENEIQDTSARSSVVAASAPGESAAAPAILPFVSVVVPCYNRAAFLPRCLGALFAQSYPRHRFEIVLVDDGSTDGTARAARPLARHWSGRLRVVEQPNGGPASARNAGIRAATGEIVAFTDSDCVADADWLERVVAPLVADPQAAGVGGPIANVAPEGRVARFLDATAFYRHRVRGGAVDYLLTANVAFRRAALTAVGGFSEREGAWGEDADLSFRLRQAGHRLLLAPAGRVTHYGSPMSVFGLARELYRYGHGASVLSRNGSKRSIGRRPSVELLRHGAAALLSPALALRYAARVGLLEAASFCPLFALEHGAFVAGLLRGEARAVTRWVARRGGWAAEKPKTERRGRAEVAEE